MYTATDLNKLAQEWYQLYRIILNFIAHASIKLPVINKDNNIRTGEELELIGIVKEMTYLQIEALVNGIDLGEAEDVVLTPLDPKMLLKYPSKGLVEILKAVCADPERSNLFTLGVKLENGREITAEIIPDVLHDMATIWNKTRRENYSALLMKGVLYD